MISLLLEKSYFDQHAYGCLKNLYTLQRLFQLWVLFHCFMLDYSIDFPCSLFIFFGVSPRMCWKPDQHIKDHQAEQYILLFCHLFIFILRPSLFFLTSFSMKSNKIHYFVTHKDNSNDESPHPLHTAKLGYILKYWTVP